MYTYFIYTWFWATENDSSFAKALAEPNGFTRNGARVKLLKPSCRPCWPCHAASDFMGKLAGNHCSTSRQEGFPDIPEFRLKKLLNIVGSWRLEPDCLKVTNVETLKQEIHFLNKTLLREEKSQGNSPHAGWIPPVAWCKRSFASHFFIFWAIHCTPLHVCMSRKDNIRERDALQCTVLGIFNRYRH